LIVVFSEASSPFNGALTEFVDYANISFFCLSNTLIFQLIVLLWFYTVQYFIQL